MLPFLASVDEQLWLAFGQVRSAPKLRRFRGEVVMEKVWLAFEQVCFAPKLRWFQGWVVKEASGGRAKNPRSRKKR